MRFEEGELNDYIEALDLGELFDPNLFNLLHEFEEAKNFGSLIQPCLDEQTIANARCAIEAKDLGGQLFLRETHLKVLRVFEQAEVLAQRYYVVVANPPYMGSGGMNPALRKFARTHFPESYSDLFAAFIERGLTLLVERGCVALVTMQGLLYLSSYEGLRRKLLLNRVVSCVDIGFNAFPELNSKIALGAAFVVSREENSTAKGTYVGLNNCPPNSDKGKRYLQAIGEGQFTCLVNSTFSNLPGCVFAYWATDKVRSLLSGVTISSLGDTKRGLQAGDKAAMVRSWTEIGLDTFEQTGQDRQECIQSRKRWFKFDSGGPVRRWFGNNDQVVDWEKNGQRIKNGSNPIVPSESRYFTPGFVWSRITIIPSFRQHDGGVINGDLSPCFFPPTPNLGILGLLNSNATRLFLNTLSPSVTFLVSDVLKVPFVHPPHEATYIAEKCVAIARCDWDNFETSWDFGDQPLLRPGLKGVLLEASWRYWDVQSNAAIRRMQELETENNRLFISAYGLDGVLQPEVPDEQITLSRAEVRKDMAAFLSYATGCMMGRYSLDQPGLLLADSRDSQAAQLAAYESKVGKPLREVQFMPDLDGIIPVLDGEWFEDDIVARTCEFLEVTFPESTVTENLRFIEESLGKDIRKYFCSEFYKDHLQTYKKRPIYWMVQSPKKGFSCLIYLHRYTKDTLNQVLNNYFRPYLLKLEAHLAKLGIDQLDDSLTTRERTAARKEAEKITKVLKECQAWEQDSLLPLAQQRIELDLDDGVKVNYLKLQDVLAPILGLAAKEE